MARTDRGLLAGAGFAGGFVTGRAWGSPEARFARMAGATIAGPDAAGWVTDFLNAAYYRRPSETREVDDLRLAFSVVTTFWARRGGRRLRGGDVLSFHRAFGRARFLDGRRSGRGTLDRSQLLAGAGDLLGDWFGEAYADDARRGWGIAFPSPVEKAAHDPERRLAKARVGVLTPGVAPPAEQTWHTYPTVPMPSADAVVAALLATETWPDYASELGRFTPLRACGLLGQTFEIEVVAGTAAGRPLITRGYVTITRLATSADPEGLRSYVDELNDGLARFGRDEPAAVPPGATPVAALDLTTHEGHFMGRGHNRLVLFEQDGRALVRAAGTWDPMPWHLEQAYRRAGRDAQHAFWGQGDDPRQSMLHQLGRRLERAAGASAR